MAAAELGFEAAGRAGRHPTMADFLAQSAMNAKDPAQEVHYKEPIPAKEDEAAAVRHVEALRRIEQPRAGTHAAVVIATTGCMRRFGKTMLMYDVIQNLLAAHPRLADRAVFLCNPGDIQNSIERFDGHAASDDIRTWRCRSGLTIQAMSSGQLFAEVARHRGGVVFVDWCGYTRSREISVTKYYPSPDIVLEVGYRNAQSGTASWYKPHKDSHWINVVPDAKEHAEDILKWNSFGVDLGFVIGNALAVKGDPVVKQIMTEDGI